MKLTVKTKELARGLSVVSAAITSKSPLPILFHVKFSASKVGLTLATTDLDLFIETKIEADIQDNGETCIPFRLINPLITRLAAPEVSMEVKKSFVEVKTADFVSSIDVLDATEFPLTPKVESDNKIQVSAESFVKPISMVAHAISTDTSRYVLTGVNIASAKTGLEFVATNGSLLSMVASEIMVDKISAIIPNTAVSAILKNITKGDITVVISGSSIQIDGDEAKITSRLIEGKFPSYHQVIPEPGKKVFSCSRAQLIQAMQTASLFLPEKDFTLCMTGKKKQIELSCRARSTETLLGSELHGQPDMSISFNHRYMIAVLSSLIGDDARIECTSPDDAMLIREGRFTSVMMPVRTVPKS